MTITIQKASNLNVKGVRTNKNCKPVFCITTGEVYASSIDAAEANGLCRSTMNWLVNNNGTSRSGKKFCYVSSVVDHLEEIAECNRIRQNKVAAYDAITAKEEAKRRAAEEYEKRKANCEMLQQKLAKEMSLMEEAEKEVKLLNENNNTKMRIN